MLQDHQPQTRPEQTIHCTFVTVFCRCLWQKVQWPWSLRYEVSCVILLSIVKILRKQFSSSYSFTRFLYWTALSPFDFQDFVEQFLFLLSIFKIFRKHFSFVSCFTRFLYWTSLSPLDFQDFVEQFLVLLSISKIF